MVWRRRVSRFSDELAWINPLVSLFSSARKDKNVIAWLRAARIVKNCNFELKKYSTQPAAPGSIFKTSVTVFPCTDLQAASDSVLTKSMRELWLVNQLWFIRIGKNTRRIGKLLACGSDVIYEFFSCSTNILHGSSAYKPWKLVVYCLNIYFLDRCKEGRNHHLSILAFGDNCTSCFP